MEEEVKERAEESTLPPLSPLKKKVTFRHKPHRIHTLEPTEDDAVVVVNSTSPRTPRSKKKHRPKHFYESPRIYIRAVFMKVGEVDTVKELFHVEAFIQARWREPALDSIKDKDTSQIKWEELWNPRISIQNQLDCKHEKIWYDLEVNPSGEAYVLEKRRVKSTFAESMELQSFPFDTQPLSLVLTSEVKDVELTEDLAEPSLVNHLSFLDEQQWEIPDIVEFVQGAENIALNEIIRFPTLLVRIFATRRSRFFISNIVAIMVLITSLSLCSFCVDRKHPNNRLQLAFTLVLTAVAYKFATSQRLPHISYLTLMDKYIMACLIILYGVCVWHGCVSLFPSDSSLADSLDVCAFIVIVVALISLQLVFTIVVKMKVNGKRRRIQQLKTEYQAKVNKLMGAGYMERKKKEETDMRKNTLRNFQGNLQSRA